MLADIKSTIKNSIIYGFGSLSSKLVGFILIPLYTKYLTVEDYGALGILEVSSQIFIGLFGFGLYQAFFRWYWDKRYSSKQAAIFFTVTVFLFLTTTFFFFLFMYHSENFSKLLFGNESFSFVLKLLVLSASLDIIIQLPNSLIRLQEKPVLFSTANMIKLAVSLSMTVYLITVRHYKLEGIYISQVIGQIIFLLILSPFIWKNLQLKFETRILKEMMIFSIPLAISSIAAILLSISDRYVLKYFGTLNDVGLYSLGYKMANTVYVIIVMSVSLAISPLIYKKMDAPDHKHFYAKLMTYYVLGVVFCAMGMSIFGKEIIKVLSYKKAFFDAHKIIPIISFSIVFIVMRDTANIGLLKMQRSKIIATTVVIASIFNIIFDIIFIKFFSGMGAAIATLSTQILYFFLVYSNAQKVYKIPYETKRLLIMIILASFLTIIALLTNNSSLIWRIPIKIFLLFAFPFMLYFLKFYEKIEIKNIQGFWRKWKNPRSWRNNIFSYLK